MKVFYTFKNIEFTILSENINNEENLKFMLCTEGICKQGTNPLNFIENLKESNVNEKKEKLFDFIKNKPINKTRFVYNIIFKNKYYKINIPKVILDLFDYVGD